MPRTNRANRQGFSWLNSQQNDKDVMKDEQTRSTWPGKQLQNKDEIDD